jgi:uncharacterized membrane protein YbhN (UPF0104 family)
VPTQTVRVGLLAAVALGFILVLFLLALGDLRRTGEALAAFQWPLLPLLLLASLINYALRWLKWEYYCRLLRVTLRPVESVVVFASGLLMTVSPGKLGEVLKSFLIRELHGIEVSRTAPIVMAERLTDVVGLVVLASLGASLLPYGWLILLGTLGAVAGFICLVQFRPLALGLLGWAQRLPVLGRFANLLTLFYESSAQLLAWKTLLPTVALSVASWFFECLALYAIFIGLGLSFSLLVATFAHAFASLAGALSMLPGGLGVTEGSITGLLVTLGAPRASAVAATLLIRAATLWFAVLLGGLCLAFVFPRLLPRTRPR